MNANTDVRAAVSKTVSATKIRKALLEKQEIALLDVREEAPFAEEHPLFAANFPLSRLELDAHARIPRPTTAIVVYDNGEGYAQRAADILSALGYTDVGSLDGGLSGWKAAGNEIFRDVNSASKAFGELVESVRHTPSFSAQEVQQMLDAKADVVVLDARRFDEYRTMSIPTSVSVPGAELVLRVRELAPDPSTQVIVNCAGRTRSIIGTQSLVNAGIPNPVAALRNGTIGWTLAGQSLQHRQQRRFGDVSEENRTQAAASARSIADRAGVQRVDYARLQEYLRQANRTTYCFDVRTPEEYLHAHLPGFRSAPGGQLVQETDHSAPVRGARIVLADDDGTRANMTASWLAQMGWDVHVLDGAGAEAWRDSGQTAPSLPPAVLAASCARLVSVEVLAGWLAQEKPEQGIEVVIVDFAASAQFVQQRIPGAWFALRSGLEAAVQNLPASKRFVLTSPDGLLARLVLQEFQSLISTLGEAEVFVLDGGTNAWLQAGQATEQANSAATPNLASPRTDRYRRPYEGTDNPVAAMQAYLDWEYGLVEQLARDGTHGFFVI
ncbi:rhodanese-like domain-containing protein [Undibacterium terreum]|uniref:Thiosulfate sulfurtransferase n=1 Tax=Undibacterium terreum TaxID=1224302 RepID=A0A916XFQ3_9BURK|nr:rhodanese-like domain-containing protein [Undibacterium terreum]GGC68784.1 thiosulfate sulfurtransferase [Undibacterium terreum]